jgi:hypothetical protein
VDAGLDAFLFSHFVHEGVAVDGIRQNDGKDVMAGYVFLIAEREAQLGDIVEQVAVQAGQRASFAVVFIQVFQLHQPDSRADFIDAVIVAQFDDIVAVAVAFVPVQGQGE